MSQPQKIVFEISQLAKWPGMVSGIPRVMDELAKRLSKDAIFVDWNPSNKCFYETTYEAAIEKRIAISSHQDSGISEQVHTLRKAVRFVKHRSKTVQKIVNHVRESQASAQEKIMPYEFSENDIFFITWGEMTDEVYTDAIVRARNEGARVVQMIHDMIPLVTPQFASHTTDGMGQYLKKILPIASAIITISRNTVKDIEQWCKSHDVSFPEIFTVPLGDDFQFAESKKPIDDILIGSHILPHNYLLTVGTIEIRKNHYLYYQMYKLAKQRGIDIPPLVIVGRRGWLTEGMYEIMKNDPDVKDKLIFLHNVSNEELSWLFENSLCSLYVSFYEGWGIPIAESIARGIPCISSNTSSMPEVADGLASYYVSPYSAEECLYAVNELLRDGKIDEEKKRIANYRQVSWNDTLTQVKKIIGNLR